MRLPTRFVILLLFVSAQTALGQRPDIVQTESDWEYLYRDGYYDYNTYQILRELVEGRDIQDTSEYMASSLALSPADIALISSNREHLASIAPSKDKIVYFPDRVKIGRKNQDGVGSGYISFNKKSGYFSTDMKARDEAGIWKIESRTLSYKRGDYDLTLGNFGMVVGCGVGIGRFDYRPVSFEPSLKKGEEILFPDNSLYNGLKISGKNLSVLFSIKKYNDVSKKSAGGFLAKTMRDFRIGLTGIGAILTSITGSRTLGAASLFLENRSGDRAVEVGYGESGIGGCMRLRGDGYNIRAWGYDDSFVNLQSSGYSHPDYKSFSDDRFELSFRQPQKGESGLLFGHEFALRETEITLTSELWKRAPGRNIAMENSVYARRWFQSALLFEGGYSDRRGIPDDRMLLDFGTSLRKGLQIGIHGYMWIHGETIDKERSNYYIYTAIPLIRDMTIKNRIRWDISGRLDYFIEQRSRIGRAFSMTATYRWSHEHDTDLGPFYLTMEKLW